MKKIVGIIALLLLFVGCGKENSHYPSTWDNISDWSKYDSLVYRSFVQSYDDMDGIKVAVNENMTILIGRTSGDEYAFWSNSENRAKYKALCQKHGDTEYNRLRCNPFGRAYTGGPWGANCLAVDFASVLVVSDAAFDQMHQAETSLNDIAMISIYPAYPFVKNNYDESQLPTVFPRSIMLGGFGGSELSKMLEFWSNESMPDMTIFATIQFINPPTLAKVHNITVTMIADDGRVFSDTVQVTWE